MTVLLPAIDTRTTDEIFAGTEISVIVPAWNGHERLPASLQQIIDFLEQQPHFTELILVDDHSSPPLETVVNLKHLNGRSNRVTTRLVHNSDPRGKGHAVASGLLKAVGRYRVFIDCDLAYPATEIATVVDALKAGSDIAIASRVLPESTYIMSPTFFSYLYTRHLMSRTFNAIVRQTLIPGVTDSQAGLKGFTARATELIFPRITVMGFAFDIECLYIARRHGLKTTQVPVTFRYDNEPTTVRFVYDAIKMLRDIAMIRWNAWLGRYD